MLCRSAAQELAADFGVRHGGGTLQLVPVEGMAGHRAFQRFDEHDGKQLAIGEALQPDMEKKFHVFAIVGRAPLPEKRERRSDEVYDQEYGKENNQLFEIAGIGGVRVEIAADRVTQRAPHEHQIDE